MNIYTIGFTKSSAKHFFDRLTGAGVKRVVDVRLNNTSQLSAFAKSKDLEYFLRALANIEYLHEPLLAPTRDILDGFKKFKGSWGTYEQKFLGLMEVRKVDKKLNPGLLEDACLLCSEDTPHYCHRRLVAEFLKDRWNTAISIIHL
jgi:uncharacterized protein (DUF488 family)